MGRTRKEDGARLASFLGAFLLSLALSSCGGGAPSLSRFLRRAHQENEEALLKGDPYLWSHAGAGEEGNGTLVFFANYGNPPKDLGDLGEVRASLYPNIYFSNLYFEKETGERQGSYFLNVRGEARWEGESLFADPEGRNILPEEIAEGDVFLIRRSEPFDYLLPAHLSITEAILIGSLGELPFERVPAAH